MNWMHYLVEANLYMAAFYALYLLFLRSETHYQLNRAYLLGTSLLAFIIPFVQLGVLKPVVQTSTQISVGNLSGYAVALAPATVYTEPKWTIDDYIMLIYGLIAIVLFISLCIRVYLLMALLKKGSVTKSSDYNIIELHQGSVAFSFFNNLFIDDRLASSKTVLRHEQVHIRQKHSWDIIYLEFLKIINWFNPIVYLLIASIKEVHEFIADEETAVLENNNDSYTDFLISNAYGITQNSLTNSFFNKNLLKRRITMLYQKKSGKAARLKYLLALPLICGLLCLSTLAFTTKTYGYIDMIPNHIYNLTASDASAKTHSRGPILRHESTPSKPIDGQSTNTKVEPVRGANSNPTYPGGANALFKFLKGNIDHDVTKADGDVENHLSLVFVVEKTGDLSHIDIYRMPGGQFTDATITEVKRVLASGPKWIPAVVNGETISQKSFVIFDFTKDKNELVFRPDTNKVFTAVQIQPEFPGGIPALNKFVQTYVRYPKADHDNKVQGRAYIQFIVEQDGSIDNLKVLRTPSDAMGTEAMRVMASSPKWKPGMQNGKPVRVEFTMPINFALGNDGPNAPFNISLQPPPPALPAKPDGNNVHTLPPPPVKEVEANANTVYTAVEIQPEFPGGEAAFAKFLQQTIRYPATAKQNKIQGKVYVQFIVEKDGSITDIKVIREPGSALGDEAVRVMKLSPKWIPAKQNGQPVRIQFTLPVSFSLGD
jgi:TonB family protein